MTNPMWGGRFSHNPDALMTAINASIDFDNRLFKYDILASIAHCNMLVASKILTKAEGEAIVEGLRVIEVRMANGEIKFSRELEDIHMNIEHHLTELIGEPGKKLHTARSRNDQVVTDLRLYVRDHIDLTINQLQRLQLALVKKAADHTDTIMPGFTHLQTAQPIVFAHHLLAYVEMLERDIDRFRDGRKRVNICPLGSAALAGTSFAIDRQRTADELGFAALMANSIDGVSSRDFVIEIIAVAAIMATNLSRFAEELVLWSSQPFAFVRLSDDFTTGSSIMPQKRNPDAAELIRAKIGRIIGALNCLLVVMKGLPLAYSKDMQEDKEPLFDTFATVDLIISAMTAIVSDMTIDSQAMLALAERGYPTATDLADWLVRVKNIPFREAHHITGQIVAYAESHNQALDQVPLMVMQDIDSRISKEICEVLSLKNSINSRQSYGATAPDLVRQQIKAWLDRLAPAGNK